jgi:transaldolase
MKFFIDTANLDQIREYQELGILDGVTTNPTLLAKERADPVEQLKKICEIVDGPVSGEVIGLTTEEMVKEAREIAKIASNIVVKIPFTKDGIKTVTILESSGSHSR